MIEFGTRVSKVHERTFQKIPLSFHFISEIMGSYLSQPITAKETSFDENQALSYSCTAMQGWRTDMEDAHITMLDIGGKLGGVGMFAVCMSYNNTITEFS